MSDYTLSDKDIQRFWGYVDKKGENDCWLWTGNKGNDGYGRMKARGKQRPSAIVFNTQWRITQ